MTRKAKQPQWDNESILALRRHLGLTQTELAEQLGTRQQTISEWEKGMYQPRGASATLLSIVAERAKFKYEATPSTKKSNGRVKAAQLRPIDEASKQLLNKQLNELPKEQLKDVISCLTPREQRVLILRFGLDGERSHTLEEIGQEFNVTRERVRQIELKALRKLRHRSRSRKLRDYLK